jgi:hypothetical protein
MVPVVGPKTSSRIVNVPLTGRAVTSRKPPAVPNVPETTVVPFGRRSESLPLQQLDPTLTLIR